MNSTSDRSRTVILCCLLAAVTLAIYFPVIGHDFINMDDPFFVERHHVDEGLTLAGIKNALTLSDCMWFPLTWLSHTTDRQLFGLNPAGHHAVSLFIHLINTLLVFLVLRQLTGAQIKSALVAGFFAVHPVNVEAVAHIAGRKDLLSAFFWLLTVSAYAHYVRQPSLARYLTVCLAFLAGLMSKPSLVTLPVILMFLDYWPFGRLRRPWLVRRTAEKLPLLFMAIFFSVLTVITQQRAGAVLSLETLPPLNRLSNALTGYIAYLGRLVWPVDLTVFYPYPHVFPPGKTLAALVLLMLICRTVFSLRRRAPYLLTGWAWFLIALLPVIGFIKAGSHAMADRYTYIPYLGLFLIIVWTLEAVLKSRTVGNALSIVMTIVLLGTLATMARQQLGFWKNSITVFEHALTVTSGNYAAHNNLGMALAQQGDRARAETHFKAALKIKPAFPLAHNNLGVLLAASNQPQAAIRHFLLAIHHDPGLIEAHYNLASEYYRLGDLTGALPHFQAALRLDPGFRHAAAIHYRIGLIMAAWAKTAQAIDRFKTVLAVQPGHIDATTRLVDIYKNRGQYDEAVTLLQSLAVARPDCSAAISYNLACVHALKNDQSQAIFWLKKSLENGLPLTDLLRTDTDLNNLRDNTEFKQLLE